MHIVHGQMPRSSTSVNSTPLYVALSASQLAQHPGCCARLQQDLDEREARGLGEHADKLQHDAQRHEVDLPIRCYGHPGRHHHLAQTHPALLGTRYSRLP